MKKILIFCLFMALSSKMAHAHNPLSASYFLEVKGQMGLLNISLSQAGFQEALAKHYPALEFDNLSELEYKKLAVDYVKNNFLLRINGNRVKLLKGGLKLGKHQTDLKFITSELPESFDTMELTINAFKENDHHQSIFSLALNGTTDKVILSKNNDYSASAYFEKGRMVVRKEGFHTEYLWWFSMIPLFLVGKILLSPAKHRT